MALSLAATIVGQLCIDYQSVKKINGQAHEKYKKASEERPTGGEKEKKLAITKLIRELESAEKALLAASAKTISRLYPNLPNRPGKSHRSHYLYTPKDPLPYETRLTFQVPDLNETKREGYRILFEAAWSNDIDTIKSITLGLWETPIPTEAHIVPTQVNKQNSPLNIAVRDGNGFSPFTIAVPRGHRDLAREIIDICLTNITRTMVSLPVSDGT